MQVKIRKAVHDDVKTLVHFQKLLAKETEDVDLNELILSPGINKVLNDHHIGHYWVMTTVNDHKNIIGCALTLKEWSDWRNGDVLWIHSVFVIPDYRRQKIFSQFYLFLKEMVLDNQSEYKGLRLYVDKRNKVAQKVYEQLGMTSEHYELYEWLK